MLRQQGRIADAVHAFEEAARNAANSGQSANEAEAELGLVGCYIRLFAYREALEHSNRALELANSADDATLKGAAYGDIATVYKEVGDMASAAAAADKSSALLARSSRPDFYAKALLNSAGINAGLGRNGISLSFFRAGIQLARSRNQPDMEAMLEEDLAEVLLDMHDLAGAEIALKEARRLRIQTQSRDFGVIDERLARLQFLQQNYPAALAEIRSLEASHSPRFAILTPWELPNLKGKVLLAMGRKREALAAFESAVLLENQRREDVLPAEDSSLRTVITSAEAYSDYIELAAGMAAERKDSQLARKALEILMGERAWAIRTEIMGDLRRQWKVPPLYYQQLHELQDLQAEVTLGTNPNELRANEVKLHELRLSLTNIENNSLLADEKISFQSEKHSHKTSLSDIQDRLGRDELVCSFFLAHANSFLWTVTKDRMDLLQLPPQQTIETDSAAFTREVRSGTADRAAASALSRDLFSKIPAGAAKKPNWLLTLDGALLDGVPLSALPAPGKTGESLIVSHTLRLLAAEAFLSATHAEPPASSFLGIADPIYNLADSRGARQFTTVSLPHAASIHLARLVGSDREARRSAQSAQLQNAVILTGAQSSAAELQRALLSRPEIVHFAVHVVSPEEHGQSSSEQAALALSLSPSGRPELLTRESIAALRVPGSLVVLSGCASQQGEVVPAGGIVGLSRAWLLAGASAVLVTAWPTPDDSGQFFQSFYSHFRNATGNLGQRAAAALQAAQADMKASSGYRSKPSFWSAYSLISKE